MFDNEGHFEAKQSRCRVETRHFAIFTYLFWVTRLGGIKARLVQFKVEVKAKSRSLTRKKREFGMAL
jgi:hypothetical protein